MKLVSFSIFISVHIIISFYHISHFHIFFVFIFCCHRLTLHNIHKHIHGKLISIMKWTCVLFSGSISKLNWTEDKKNWFLFIHQISFSRKSSIRVNRTETKKMYGKKYKFKWWQCSESNTKQKWNLWQTNISPFHWEFVFMEIMYGKKNEDERHLLRSLDIEHCVCYIQFLLKELFFLEQYTIFGSKTKQNKTEQKKNEYPLFFIKQCFFFVTFFCDLY